MTAAYTAAGAVIPPSARGAGFGVLTTASLVGLAISPIVSGMLGGDQHPRGVSRSIPSRSSRLPSPFRA